MIRIFIEVPLFSKRWKELGFDDNDLRILQEQLLKEPKTGVLMQGTGGIRKMRFALPGKGKSGGVRVCYVDYEEYRVIYLITVFAKKDQQNLTQEEKNMLKSFVKQLKEETARRFKHE